MMKIMISLIILGFSISSWGEDSNYLEGISILGEKRIAYLALPGGKISVTEGDEITINEGKAKGTWQVVLIKQDSVLFKTHQGSTAELRLEHRSPLPAASESATTKLSNDELAAINSEKSIAANELATTTNPEELIIDIAADNELATIANPEELIIDNEEMNINEEEVNIDEEIPPVTLREPLIDENEPNTQALSLPSEPAATVANTSPEQQPVKQEELPPDRQVVTTPFGSFTIKK